MTRTQHYEVTLASAIAHYQQGDFTAKGLLHFYFKIHPLEVAKIWVSATANEQLREQLGIQKLAFYSALNKLHEEKSI